MVHGQTLKGFDVAGEDQQFFPAQAKIEGNEVVLSSPHVAKPVAARYAWANDPKCNLYNKAGLPAPPFRTDDWTVSTQAVARKPEALVRSRKPLKLCVRRPIRRVGGNS